MDALGGFGGGHGWLWWKANLSNAQRRRKGNGERGRRHRASSSKSSAEDAASAGRGGGGYQFPLKQAVTAGSLALTGDTIAQFTQRLRNRRIRVEAEQSLSNSDVSNGDIPEDLISGHDWLRALRMSSYGFLFYGPGSYVWYQFLDRHLPQLTVQNLVLKVFLNQVILGPCVIAVVFAWNNLWQGKISEIPKKYQNDALPTLLYGFRFWIPVSALNFWIVPLQARVAFMSMGSIFWNFVLSSTMSK